MMRRNGDIARSFVAWCVVGPSAGALALCAVFYLPVIFGQPIESMVGWGWITTIPAIIAGVFAAGKACTALLAHWKLSGSERSAFLVGGLIAGVCYGAVVVLTLGSSFMERSRQVPLAEEPASLKVELEILEEKSYDPPLMIRDDRQASRSRWSELSWDPIRAARCETLLLKPETRDGPHAPVSYLFTGDPTGSRKVRHTGHAICDSEAIWFLDYVAERGRTTVTKYSPAGDLIYRLSFEKPNEPRGCAGGIMMPTFVAADGYLHFEWWNTNQSGSDRYVVRSLRVRIKEPSEK